MKKMIPTCCMFVLVGLFGWNTKLAYSVGTVQDIPDAISNNHTWLFLPIYSADLNLVEKKGSQLKAIALQVEFLFRKYYFSRSLTSLVL